MPRPLAMSRMPDATPGRNFRPPRRQQRARRPARGPQSRRRASCCRDPRQAQQWCAATRLVTSAIRHKGTSRSGERRGPGARPAGAGEHAVPARRPGPAIMAMAFISSLDRRWRPALAAVVTSAERFATEGEKHCVCRSLALRGSNGSLRDDRGDRPLRRSNKGNAYLFIKDRTSNRNIPKRCRRSRPGAARAQTVTPTNLGADLPTQQTLTRRTARRHRTRCPARRQALERWAGVSAGELPQVDPQDTLERRSVAAIATSATAR